jgi:2-oxoisovalerate dehydrogenase E2 component (dihydrolipoyl transacylase)
MARYEFKLPDIGEGIAEAGDRRLAHQGRRQVEEDQQIADMMTDKATVEMESPVSGNVLELAGEVGDQVPIGSVLVVVDTQGDALPKCEQDGTETNASGERVDDIPMADGAIAPTQAMEAEIPTTDVTSAREPVRAERSAQRAVEVRESPTSEKRPSTSLPQAGGGEKALASPAVRQRARDLESTFPKSAPAATESAIPTRRLSALQRRAPSRTRSAERQDESIKVVGLRRKIAENMAEAKRRIPHFTLVEEFDVTALEETRAMMNRDRGSQPKLTLLPFLIAAMGKAIAEWADAQRHLDDDAMMVTSPTVQSIWAWRPRTPGGLMLPVIRNAESMSVWQIASEPRASPKPRAPGKATRDELTGLYHHALEPGPMGGITSTPVINRPRLRSSRSTRSRKSSCRSDEIEVGSG